MVPYGADSLLITAVILPFLSIIAVSLRIYVQLGMRHTYIGVDDWLVLLSVFLVCGQGVIQILGKVSSYLMGLRISCQTSTRSSVYDNVANLRPDVIKVSFSLGKAVRTSLMRHKWHSNRKLAVILRSNLEVRRLLLTVFKAEPLHRRHRESNLFRHQTERAVFVSPCFWSKSDFSKDHRLSNRSGRTLGLNIFVS